MITNAQQHKQRHGIGRWVMATRAEECSRYFGTVRGCAPILAGQKSFDTEEPIPVAGRRGTYRTCAACGLALAVDFEKKWKEA